jgi:hypothetical protein
VFDAHAWVGSTLQYTAAGSMAQANLTNATGAYVDLPLNNGIELPPPPPPNPSPPSLPTSSAAGLFSPLSSRCCSPGRSVVGEVYAVAVALSAASAASSLTITASVVENGVDTGAQHDAASRTFKQPPRAGRSVPAAAAAALVMGRNYSVVVTKGAYAYWSLDVTPGYELRCSLQVRARCFV